MPHVSTVDQVEEAVAHHVFESDDPIVFAITGGWGEGKTYFWKKTIMPRFAELRPGYVSVFGADDIGSIRERVVVSAGENIALDDESILDRAKKKYPWLSQVGTAISRKLKQWSGDLGLPDSFVDQLMEKFLLEENWVICIDDVERLSKNVGTDTFLGYVNELREERRLKIVLIFNDNWLVEQKDKAFEQYREKVIDLEVPFVPELNEIVRYVTKDAVTSENEFRERIAAHCQDLNLRNIRVLGKAIRYFNVVAAALPVNPDREFLFLALRTLILLSWIKFSSDSTISLEDLKGYSSMGRSMIRSAKEGQGLFEEEEEDAVEKLLTNYGYHYTDDLAFELIKYVVTGILDTAELRNEYEKHVNNTSRGKLYEEFRKAWQIQFHGTYKDNSEDFSKKIVSATVPFLEFISVEQIDSVAHVLGQLGFEGQANDLFSKFLASRPSFYREYEEMSSMIEPLKYGPLINAMQDAKEDAERDERTLGQLLEDIWENDFIPEKERIRFATFSADDLVEYFTTQEQEKLNVRLRRLCQMSRQGSTEEDKAIQEALTETVTKLAEMSEINKLRLRAMGLIPQEPKAK